MERPSRPTGGGPDDLTTLLTRIDPARIGPRLRAARKNAGLSQTAVAGEAFSSAYVSRIEDGSRSATLRFLEHAASRLGLTPEALITGLDAAERDRLMVELDRGEFLLSETDSSPAAAVAEAVLETLADADDPRLLRRALRLRAGVREAAGELAAAAADLELVVGEPVADLEWVRDLISLNRCYREAGDLDLAIALDHRFAAAIAELDLDETTEAIQFATSIAGTLALRGDLGRAYRLCARAITRADASGSAVARASALWNQSVVVQMRGDLEYAILLATDALRTFEDLGDTRNLSRLRMHLVNMMLQTDSPDPEGALAQLDRVAVEIDWSHAGTVDRSRQRLSLARAARLSGDVELAHAALDESIVWATPDSVDMRAAQTAMKGRLALDRGDIDEARTQYRTAVSLLSSIGADVDAAELWFELAEDLDRAGESQLALDAYRRAAASRGMRPVFVEPPR